MGEADDEYGFHIYAVLQSLIVKNSGAALIPKTSGVNFECQIKEIAEIENPSW